MANCIFTLIGGMAGNWKVLSMVSVAGAPLEKVPRIAVLEGDCPLPMTGAQWRLRGVTSYERYVTRAERNLLTAVQPGLGRAEATCAALIPIRKSARWWELPQDERRALFETRSGHIRMGLEYLPAVARRLYHSRDLGEPFDFLTWFEYAPSHEMAFDELVAKLRRSEEWNYVEREIDIRLVRDDGAPTAPLV